MSNIEFQHRHIGVNPNDIQHMLDTLGYSSLEELTNTVVPDNIQLKEMMKLPDALSEEQALAELSNLAQQNQVMTSLIGQGYYDTFTPKVLQRNVLENPAWYTAYTPYQPEISQGRLEVLFYFQTLITELTGLDIANASLLDEPTAAAEAMMVAFRAAREKKHRFLVSKYCHPQTLEVLATRAESFDIELIEFNETQPLNDSQLSDVFGVIVQYPTTFGDVYSLEDLSACIKKHKALLIVATDLLALTLLRAPGEFGADIVIGNSQRFGVPLGFGGPHAGFMATLDKYKRSVPGRLVGQSIDANGNAAYRLALQTREQHIRREKATSNICTAQALLAMMATLYACYHGPQGLKNIASRVHRLTSLLAKQLQKGGVKVLNQHFFDTLHIGIEDAAAVSKKAVASGYNINQRGLSISISLDETSTLNDVKTILSWFSINADFNDDVSITAIDFNLASSQLRQDKYLSQDVFHQYHSETEMMRYLRRLSDKDIALDRAMISLGSCTMKLNAASEMAPISWPEFSRIHPFAPQDQTLGYQKMIAQLEDMLCEITGYDGLSLQPNAGSQGEYAGLLAIKAYHEAKGDYHRDICLIPSSAHGTNPASASMAKMRVVIVACDDNGNIDIEDLKTKIAADAEHIAAIMITYPSTHGVFEEEVTEVCNLVHQAGGQVYIDGANLNAMVGVAQPGKLGGDVSHLNLHKTFCIPHGGGGPGVGPVAVGEHLKPYLPKDDVNNDRQGAMVSGAPFGSASILPISWMYIRMMGAEALRKATQVAILNANYMAKKLSDKYSILYTGNRNLVAHEFILDTRPLKEYGVSVEDIAKRLIDFGFHAPTMSFPVAGTLMVEPTESESLAELDRFCRAMLLIHEEVMQVANGELPPGNNPLVNAPHTSEFLLKPDSELTYSREQAIFPDSQLDKSQKYWPPVGRVDNAHGDKNLICSCPSIESYSEDVELTGTHH